MILIVTELMNNEQGNDQAAGNAGSQAKDIDQYIGFLAAEGP